MYAAPRQNEFISELNSDFSSLLKPSVVVHLWLTIFYYKSGTEEAVKSHTTSKAFNDCGYEKLTSLGRVVNISRRRRKGGFHVMKVCDCCSMPLWNDCHTFTMNYSNKFDYTALKVGLSNQRRCFWEFSADFSAPNCFEHETFCNWII